MVVNLRGMEGRNPETVGLVEGPCKIDLAFHMIPMISGSLHQDLSLQLRRLESQLGILVDAFALTFLRSNCQVIGMCWSVTLNMAPY